MTSISTFAHVDQRDLSKMARRGYAHLGRGLLLSVFDERGLAPQTAYLAATDVTDYFGALADLLCRVQETIRRYDPEQEFILMEIGRGEDPVLCVMRLA